MTLFHTSAERLNQACFCRTLNLSRLREQLENDPSLSGLMETIAQTRPNLFSSTVVFISAEVQHRIHCTVAAIERIATLPGYQSQALARAPALAQQAFGPLGACMGYDFHLGEAGPQLIEINTNAGGLLLNLALARAQEVCCDEMSWAFPSHAPGNELADVVFAMFQSEWRHQRKDQDWHSVVIVDDDPAQQYLAPEFELFRQLFAQRGVSASIADPRALSWQGGQLWHQGAPVEMVYNRLTDFYLAEPAHETLRLAYETGAIVMTPHPHAHALYAEKRNLIALGTDEFLMQWGAEQPDRFALQAGIPETELVTLARSDELWARRRHLFFKPVAGYGAKAAYRGDKLTRRVWDAILAGDFVAQALVPPSARMIELDGVLTDLKFDIRAYTYAGKIQMLAARMYAGQTTNFRTQGGGFAPVIVVPSKESA